MIKLIMDLLHASDWINSGDMIEIAKGRYELPTTVKESVLKLKRQWKSRNKKA